MNDLDSLQHGELRRIGGMSPAPYAVNYNKVVQRGFFLTITQSVTTQSIAALAQQGRRIFLSIQNQHTTSSLFVNFGVPADSTHTQIFPLQTFVFDVIPVNSIYLTASAGTVPVAIIEGVEL